MLFGYRLNSSDTVNNVNIPPGILIFIFYTLSIGSNSPQAGCMSPILLRYNYYSICETPKLGSKQLNHYDFYMPTEI